MEFICCIVDEHLLTHRNKWIHPNQIRASFALLSISFQDWEAMRVLIGDTNKMKARLKEQNPGDIPPEVADKARGILQSIDRSQIQHVSEVAAAFFAWVRYTPQPLSLYSQGITWAF